MKYFKVYYTIYNVDGTIRKTGTICKLIQNTLKRMQYLKTMYPGMIKFY